jgi:hypothetical protein
MSAIYLLTVLFNLSKELEECRARERGMEGLDKGGQGQISGCCAIEEEESFYHLYNLF